MLTSQASYVVLGDAIKDLCVRNGMECPECVMRGDALSILNMEVRLTTNPDEFSLEVYHRRSSSFSPKVGDFALSPCNVTWNALAIHACASMVVSALLKQRMVNCLTDEYTTELERRIVEMQTPAAPAKRTY